MHTQRRGHVSTQKWLPPTNQGKRPQNETNPASALVLHFPAPRKVRDKFKCLSHPVWGILLWQPKQTNTSTLLFDIWMGQAVFELRELEFWLQGISLEENLQITICKICGGSLFFVMEKCNFFWWNGGYFPQEMNIFTQLQCFAIVGEGRRIPTLQIDLTWVNP